MRILRPICNVTERRTLVQLRHRQSQPDLVEAIGIQKEPLCTYCWDGCEGGPSK